MIKSKDEIDARGMKIDLRCPEGNAYSLLGIAQKLLKQIKRDPQPIIQEMMGGRLRESYNGF